MPGPSLSYLLTIIIGTSVILMLIVVLIGTLVSSNQRLKKERNFTSSILDTTMALIIVLDSEGRIVRFNRACEKLTGYLASEVEGCQISYLGLLPEELMTEGGKIEDPGDVELQRHLESRWTSRDGMQHIITWSKRELRSTAGDIKWIIFTGIDITERKRLEEMLRETEKFAATGQLAARVAHEINNPLGGIKNSFELIKSAIPSDHTYYEYVGRIEKEIGHIARIVRQMFNLYRPDHDSVHEFQVDETVSEVISILEGYSNNQQVSLSGDISRASVRVQMPESLLRQILFNLILNAIEASPPGGVVTVNAVATDDSLYLEISDQGRGIPGDIQSQIFEPFFTTKSIQETGGMGLGLSITRSIVRALKGTIDFESSKDKGTVFRVSIPLN